MGRDLVTHRNWLDYSEGDVSAFSEKFAVVLAVMLSRDHVSRAKGPRCRQTNIDETGRTQEEVILLQRFRVNNAEIPADISVPEACPFEFPIFLVSEISHGALQLGDNRSRL